MRLVIEAGNPLVTSAEDLEELANEMRRQASVENVTIAQRDNQRGYGVTWWELVWGWVTLENVANVAEVSGVIGSFVLWARKRQRRRAQERRAAWGAEQAQKPPRRRARKVPEPSHRPIYIGIYGPDGTVIRSVLVKDPESEPEDQTIKDQQQAEQYGLRRLPPSPDAPNDTPDP